MDKKKYQAPSIGVIKLRHKTFLLSDSEQGTSLARQYRSSWDEE